MSPLACLARVRLPRHDFCDKAMWSNDFVILADEGHMFRGQGRKSVHRVAFRDAYVGLRLTIAWKRLFFFYWQEHGYKS
jgi:hypothetical protein